MSTCTFGYWLPTHIVWADDRAELAHNRATYTSDKKLLTEMPIRPWGKGIGGKILPTITYSYRDIKGEQERERNTIGRRRGLQLKLSLRPTAPKADLGKAADDTAIYNRPIRNWGCRIEGKSHRMPRQRRAGAYADVCLWVWPCLSRKILRQAAKTSELRETCAATGLKHELESGREKRGPLGGREVGFGCRHKLWRFINDEATTSSIDVL